MSRGVLGPESRPPLVMVATPGETWIEVPGAPGPGEWEVLPRVMEFPVIGAWLSDGNEDEF